MLNDAARRNQTAVMEFSQSQMFAIVFARAQVLRCAIKIAINVCGASCRCLRCVFGALKSDSWYLISIVYLHTRISPTYARRRLFRVCFFGKENRRTNVDAAVGFVYSRVY